MDRLGPTSDTFTSPGPSGPDVSDYPAVVRCPTTRQHSDSEKFIAQNADTLTRGDMNSDDSEPGLQNLRLGVGDGFKPSALFIETGIFWEPRTLY